MNAAFVACQGARLCERAIAHVALVWSDVLMAHVVHDQAGAARERLAALAKLADVVCLIIIIT